MTICLDTRVKRSITDISLSLCIKSSFSVPSPSELLHMLFLALSFSFSSLICYKKKAAFPNKAQLFWNKEGKWHNSTVHRSTQLNILIIFYLYKILFIWFSFPGLYLASKYLIIIWALVSEKAPVGYWCLLSTSLILICVLLKHPVSMHLDTSLKKNNSSYN